jgi:hypothetical protein
MAAESKPRPRTAATARKSGSTFERAVADALALQWQPGIDRKVRAGAKDEGDIGGMTVGGQPVVVECKNVRTMALGTWWNEATDEAANLWDSLHAKGRAPDNTHAIVVHKRHGWAVGHNQWVTMPLWQLVNLLEAAGGQR